MRIQALAMASIPEGPTTRPAVINRKKHRTRKFHRARTMRATHSRGK